jgi:hypothetical protein
MKCLTCKNDILGRIRKTTKFCSPECYYKYRSFTYCGERHPNYKVRKKGFKFCPVCDVEKPECEFFKNSATYDNLSSLCRNCVLEDTKQRARRLRNAVIEFLGGKCIQCGFSDKRALQIDHINGDGFKDRKKRSQYKFYNDIIIGNSNDVQLLCANCNWIKKSINDENYHGKQ